MNWLLNFNKDVKDNPFDFQEDQIRSGVLCSRKAALFYPQQPYQFADPCPESMRGVKISDLSSVDINWKMLTLARPATKTDEEIFSKLVQLDKLRLQTRSKEAEISLARGGKDPFIVVKQPSASRGGVAETSIKTCSECSEEFCSGTCKEFQYDAYQRYILDDKDKDLVGEGKSGKGKKKKLKRKVHKKKKKKVTSIEKMPIQQQ